jgi:hypothetical protein
MGEIPNEMKNGCDACPANQIENANGDMCIDCPNKDEVPISYWRNQCKACDANQIINTERDIDCHKGQVPNALKNGCNACAPNQITNTGPAELGVLGVL